MARRGEKNSPGKQPAPIMETRTMHPALIHGGILAVIMLCGLACYATSFDVPFVLDDVTSILTNPQVHAFRFTLKPRILGELSFALNYQANGLDPAGYHVVNLLLHLVNAIFVYLLVQLLCRTPLATGTEKHSPGHDPVLPRLIGFGAALLFVSHPLQTQAVTYIAQRVAVLAAFFYLGALLCYAASRLSGKRTTAAALLCLSLLLAIAGVLTKENAVTIPAMILLFELTFFRGDWRSRLLPLGWYLLPLLIAPLLMLGRFGITADLLGEVSRMTAESGAPPRMTYLLTQFPVIVTYLKLFLLPVGQSLDHDVPLRTTLLDPAVSAALLLLAAVAGAGIRLWLQARRAAAGAGILTGMAAFGIGWYFIALMVESSVIPIRDVMFEHRLYLPSVGLVLLASTGAGALVNRLARADRRRAIYSLLGVFIISGGALSAGTIRRNAVWQSEITLWQDVVAKSPAKARGYGALGHAFQRAGRLQEAEQSYRSAIRLAPTDHIALNNLAAIYLKQQRYQEASTALERSITLAPATAAAHFNLGLARGRLGNWQQAEAAFAEALRLKPDYREAAANLAAIRQRR